MFLIWIYILPARHGLERAQSFMARKDDGLKSKKFTMETRASQTSSSSHGLPN